MGYGVAMPMRCYRRMSTEDRETLSLGLAHGHSLRTKASVLGRAPSTVSRESSRNASRDRPYRACTAQTLAAARACQPRRPRKLLNPWLWQYVRTHLAQGCSPEQIAGRLRRAYPDDMRKQLSAETLHWTYMCCPVAPCGAHCWPRCVRRGGRIDGARSPT
jgi:transposase, IS30 family